MQETKTKIGTKLRTKKGTVVEVCERDPKKDLLGMPYKGITVKDSIGQHFYIPFENLKNFEVSK
jgi:hypothetical protein